MKTIITAVLLIGALCFGGLYFQQVQKTHQAQSATASLEQKVAEIQTTLQEQEKKATRLQEQLEQARNDVAAKAQEVTQLRTSVQASATNQAQAARTLAAQSGGAAKAKPANALSELFKSPEMKDMIKTQQKTALSAMIDKNYGRLFTDLHLSPEQASGLKNLILNKQLEAAQMGVSMLTGEQDSAKRSELGQQIKAATDAADAQIKDFLGADNYNQFQSYEKTLGERMTVNTLKDQLGGGANALSDVQEQQLIDAMSQERQSFKFSTDFSDKSKFNGDFASMFTEEKVNTYFDELNKLNQQYLGRAQTILSPDQLTAFEKSLTTQQALQKAGMQMAAKMFAPAKPNAEGQ